MMFGNNPGTDETWKRIPEGSIGAELGVWKGESSEKFLRRAGHLHLVDSWSVAPYVDSDEHGDYNSYLNRYATLVGDSNPQHFQQYYDNIYEGVIEKFKDKPVTIHRMTTSEFFDEFDGEYVDWVYVDASHAYKGCLDDLFLSLRIVKKGGSIFGDDYGDAKPGVRDAVDKFIKDTGLTLDNFYQDQFEIKIP